MKKVLRKRDLLLLTLGGIGDMVDEIRDPLHLVSSAYKNMYGFVPDQYKKHNFSLLVSSSLRTGHIERIVEDGKSYLRLTAAGKGNLERRFPITTLTKTWNKKWIIVIFDIEEKSRGQRDKLRNMLKNIGFGILQKSTWITPLPIGQDVKEFIFHQGFSDKVFVLEVSHVLLGDPQVLARRVWNLDELEEEYLDLKQKIEEAEAVNSIKNVHDRNKNRYRDRDREQNQLGSYKEKMCKERMLEFLLSLPPLPRELFTKTLQEAIAR